MNDEMEKDRNGYPQDTLDAETGYPSGGEGQCERSEPLEPGERSEPLEPRERSEQTLEPSERSEQTFEPRERSEPSPSSPTLEERVKAECRRSCRRKFWTEMLKTVAKVAGVVLAAFGLSSFDQED